ncbi:MAG TPA: hypothetical protein VFR09_01775 [Alphaproteobacteria bacterium]|nr:hypothetical protein [Alphaproteobacteria bacterium]
MAEYRSIYVEDRPVGPAVGELDVISSEPPEKLNQSPPASIELARCQKGGLCEVHGPLGPNSEGLNTTLKMFDGARDEFERAVIHVPFNRLQGSAAAYATETHQGGHAPVVVVAEFSNNGDTVTIRTTPITQYGRWPHEPTTRTFNRVPNDPGPKVAA